MKFLSLHQQVFDDMYSNLQERVKQRKKREEEERIRKEEEARRLELERKAREFWTDQELDFLVKGVQKFPGGTVDRWEKIRDSLPTERTVEEVISKVKLWQSRVARGGILPIRGGPLLHPLRLLHGLPKLKSNLLHPKEAKRKRRRKKRKKERKKEEERRRKKRKKKNET
eukprot:TRINITY_DN1139_c0_g1_i4.p1 TRINITY_DN1139_c0_g1~~TRINITY_DN1139_c0_g1_i4.p1  ORF type:complete len:170 (-),score=57.27 TRINITY_DN1139_c0_g1_i4:107-616(-)